MASAVAPDTQLLYKQIVDELVALFGEHPHYRPVHAKGILSKGTFRPALTASSVSRAAHLQRDPAAITVRFSDFAGIPTVPDSDPNAGPRGMAIRFHLPGGAETDIVAHSFDGFPVNTAEEFLAFVRALAATGPGAVHPTPIETFVAGHPHSRRFLEGAKPTPTSFATESFYGVNAFRFTNRAAASRYGRYRIRPVAGEAYLDPAEAAGKPADFLFAELTERLARSPVEFRLLVQLAAEGDPVNEGALPWSDQRAQAELGTIAITSLVPDSAVAERGLIFDPLHLVDGIEPSNDPLLVARSAIYGVSYQRRHA